MEEGLNKLKNGLKAVVKAIGMKLVMMILIIGIIITFVASATYFLTIDDGTYKDDDWTSTPYGAGQYTSSISIDKDGNMTGTTSAKELWNKMIDEGSRVNLYLDGPEELIKLMNAEMITQFIDTREDPDQEIEWDKINNVDNPTLQGIIKLKRASSEGEDKTTMVYAAPDVFQSYIDEYNSSGSEDAKNNALSHFTLEKTYVSNTNTASAIAAGTTIEVPVGLGSVHTYMGWQMITSPSSTQYKLREQAGMAFDEEGFGKINGRYVIACTTTFGAVGDYIDFYQEDGSIIPCIIGDIKSQGDAGCNQYGHNNGTCIVEFIVDKDSWYSGGKGSHTNPGNSNCHPEWNQNIVKAVNGGSYFGNSTFGTENVAEGGTTVAAATEVKYNALVATWNETTEVIESNDPDVESTSNTIYNMTTTKINYQDLVSGYTMPFEYLWSMLCVTEDKDFVLDLVDLVYNSKIEITVHDSLSTNINEDIYTYTKTKKTNTSAKVVVYYTDDAGASRNSSQSGNWTDEEPNKYKITTTITTKTNTLDIAVTLADVWMAKYTQEFSYQTPEDIVSGGEEQSLDDIGYTDDPVDTGNNDTYGHARDLINKIKNMLNKSTYVKSIGNGQINYLNEDIYYSTTDRKEKITNTLKNKKYVSSPMVVEEKTDKNSEEPNFVTILLDLDNLKAKNNILDVSSWLFELLETNESTVDLIDLTKYLLYKATNIDFGVTEFDFNSFYMSDFKDIRSSIGGVDLLKEYIHYWEHSSPPPTNADGTKYIIEDDGAGHPTVGYGVDIINGGFKQEFIAAGYPITIGGEVDKAFVDALEDREIQECINYIKSMTNGLNLSEYQIYALVSRAYNCGKAGAVAIRRGSSNLDFMSSYKEYWKSEDDKFEAKDANADFNHSLYTNYMSEPVTAKDKGYMSGLERRRKSEWVLFQTGYMDVLDKWYVEGMGGSIIECAKAIHQYMEENGYTYCVYGSNSYEECGRNGKSHGLSRTFEASKSNKNTCCATYVSWVLQEAGYLTESEHNDGADNLTNLLINKGWTVITDINQFQPGDVLTYSSHVEIYAGDGTVYNAGSGKAIRNSSPQSKNISKARALRAPN